MKQFQQKDICNLYMAEIASLKITNMLTAYVKIIHEVENYWNKLPPWERDVRHGVVRPANLSLNEYHTLNNALRIHNPYNSESTPQYYLYDKKATRQIAIKEKWGQDIDKAIEEDFYNIKEWTQNNWDYYDINLTIQDNKKNEIISLNRKNIGQSDIVKIEDYLLPIINDMLEKGIEQLPEDIKRKINQYNTYQSSLKMTP